MTKRSQVWRTLRYVLLNGRKHGSWLSSDQPDPYSSGRWFQLWEASDRVKRPLRRPPVERALTFGLYFLGRIQLDDMPGRRAWDPSETLESMLAS